MSHSKETVPEVVLERFLLKELPAKQYAMLAKRLETDEELGGRLEALKASNQKIVEMFPPSVEANIIANKLHKLKTQESYNTKEATSFTWKKASLAFSSVAALFLVILTVIPWQQTDMSHQGVNLKGLEPLLEIYLRKTPEPLKIGEGKKVRQGDVLQLKYRAAGAKFGTIISYDGWGNVTLHYPDSQADKPLLKQQGFQYLTHAYELDDAPKYEKFVFITSQKKFTVKEAMDLVQKLATVDNINKVKAPEDWHSQVITLVKGE